MMFILSSRLNFYNLKPSLNFFKQQIKRYPTLFCKSTELLLLVFLMQINNEMLIMIVGHLNSIDYTLRALNFFLFIFF